MILKISSPHHISPTSHHRYPCITYPIPVVGANSLMYDDPQDFIRENNLIVEDMGRHVQCVLNFMDNQVHVDSLTYLTSTTPNDFYLIYIQRHVQCVLNFMDNQVHPYYFIHRIPTTPNDSYLIHPQNTPGYYVTLTHCPHLTYIPY